MKKVRQISKLILIMGIFTLLLAGCSVRKENNEVVDGKTIKLDENVGVRMNYPREYEKDIFSDLSEDEISEILEEILNKVSADDKYKENIDLAIEDTFIEYGIEDETSLNNAKKYIEIKSAR